ncbi:hypothetical protein B0J12DRAFT_685370, partial [Macrophomina phaseolina]
MLAAAQPPTYLLPTPTTTLTMASDDEESLTLFNTEDFEGIMQYQRDQEREQEREEEQLLDEHLEDRSKKRKGGRQIHHVELWNESRPPRDDEAVRDKHKHKIWYCKRCIYHDTSPNRIYKHLASRHQIKFTDPAKRLKTSHTIEGIFSKQAARQEGRDLDEERVLRAAINQPAMEEALVQLISRRNLPINAVTWDELQALIRSVNYVAVELLPKRTALSKLIDRIAKVHKHFLIKKLKASLSKLHFSIDVWSSPTKTSLQAIVVHWIDAETRQAAKALLALAEHKGQHGGEEQAYAFLRVIEDFEIP